MRVLVCGGRDYRAVDILDAALCVLLHDHPGLTIICGFNVWDKRYQGADQIAYEWAKARGVPVFPFPAPWRTHGRAAGPMRNAQMLADGKPQAVVAAEGGPGTADMCARAEAAGVPVRRIGA